MGGFFCEKIGYIAKFRHTLLITEAVRESTYVCMYLSKTCRNVYLGNRLCSLVYLNDLIRVSNLWRVFNKLMEVKKYVGIK